MSEQILQSARSQDFAIMRLLRGYPRDMGQVIQFWVDTQGLLKT
jgi:hypothetical protein